MFLGPRDGMKGSVGWLSLFCGHCCPIQRQILEAGRQPQTLSSPTVA